jgi:hypothetical protein
MVDQVDPVEALKALLLEMPPDERASWENEVPSGMDPAKTRRLDPWREEDRGLIEILAKKGADPLTMYVTVALEFEMPAAEFAKRTVGTELQLGLDKMEPGEA